MLRFLLAGLVVVCGVVLLFVASFGDPQAAIREVQSILPVAQMGLSSQSTTPSAATVPAAREVAQNTPPPVAEPAAPAPEMAEFQRQRDALQQQILDLQANVSQETQAMGSLRSEADLARQALRAIRQQQAENQSASAQAKQADQQELAASQQRAAAAEKQVATEQAALDRLKAEAEQAKLHAKPPQVVRSAPSDQSAPREAPEKLASNAPAAAPAPTAKPVESDPSLPNAVLDRLRRDNRLGQRDTIDHRVAAPAPPTQPAVQASAASTPVSREWLSDARAALVLGRIDEARRLLERAQVQLVFRPVGPSGGASATSSVSAGQVAEALSMLGAGDVPHAVQYIDLAIAQQSQEAGEAQVVNPGAPSVYGVPAQSGYGYTSNDQYSQTLSGR